METTSKDTWKKSREGHLVKSYKVRSFLDKASSLVIYYSYIHDYINYGNLTWASTNRADFKNLEAYKTCYSKSKYVYPTDYIQISYRAERQCYGMNS